MFGKIDRHRESALAGERQTRAEQVLMQNRLASARHDQRHIVVKKVNGIPNRERNCFTGRSAATNRIEDIWPTSVVDSQRRRTRRGRRQTLPVEKKADFGNEGQRAGWDAQHVPPVSLALLPIGPGSNSTARS